MRNQFPGYYRPSQEEFSKMWQEGTFVFDANVLLNIYRYTPQTRDELFDIFQQLIERIWIPHQAMLDYHDNREEVISQQYIIGREIGEALQGVLHLIANYKKRGHPFADTRLFDEIITQANKDIQDALNDAQQKQPDLLKQDNLLERITNLFDRKVGEKYLPKQIEEIYKELEQRYRLQIPPGYKDSKKVGFKKYGDGLMWYQIIEYAKLQKKTIIFTTDDVKDDWWKDVKGITVGPRPELVEEILSKAGVNFYMYTASQFMKHAKEFLRLQINQRAIDEIRDIEQQDKEEYQLRSTPVDLQVLKQIIDAKISPFPAVDAIKYVAEKRAATEFIDMGLGRQVSSAIEALNSYSNITAIANLGSIQFEALEQMAKWVEMLNFSAFEGLTKQTAGWAEMLNFSAFEGLTKQTAGWAEMLNFSILEGLTKQAKIMEGFTQIATPISLFTLPTLMMPNLPTEVFKEPIKSNSSDISQEDQEEGRE